MKKNELNEKIFDEILKYAVTEHVEEADKQWPPEEELENQYTLSETLEKKMQHLFTMQKRRAQIANIKRITTKAAAVILVFFTVSFVLVMNVDAWRANVMNFLSKRSEISTIFSIGQDEEVIPETHGISLPTCLPSGYKMVSLEIVEDYYLAIYKDSVSNEIRLEEMPRSFTAGIDSEDAYVEVIEVNGQQAEYFEKNNIGTLIYKYDEMFYLLSGPVTKDELIKIAESMK